MAATFIYAIVSTERSIYISPYGYTTNHSLAFNYTVASNFMMGGYLLQFTTLRLNIIN